MLLLASWYFGIQLFNFFLHPFEYQRDEPFYNQKKKFTEMRNSVLKQIKNYIKKQDCTEYGGPT